MAKFSLMWVGLIVLPLVIAALWLRRSRRATHGPKIVHLMYLPWNRQQKLKPDYNDFDRTYERDMRQRVEAQGWQLKMWTQPLLKEEFADLWSQALDHAVRPTQIVDLMRWVVVCKYGGVYVQYDSVIHCNIDQLLPSRGRGLRLFTERVLTPEQCQEAARKYPIRQGVPEEPLRVMNQVFAAARPDHPFVVRCRDTILHRMKTHQPRDDYELLHSGATSLISTLYDVYGKHDSTIEMVRERNTKRAFTVSSRGSWRTDAVQLR